MKWLKRYTLIFEAFLSEMFGESAASTVRILYGGSMKPENALFAAQPDVDGGLIGGAFLTSRAFLRDYRCRRNFFLRLRPLSFVSYWVSLSRLILLFGWDWAFTLG